MNTITQIGVIFVFYLSILHTIFVPLFNKQIPKFFLIQLFTMFFLLINSDDLQYGSPTLYRTWRLHHSYKKWERLLTFQCRFPRCTLHYLNITTKDVPLFLGSKTLSISITPIMATPHAEGNCRFFKAHLSFRDFIDFLNKYQHWVTCR